jgi:putative transposase
MGRHLAAISRRGAPDAHAVLLLDGAGWHGASDLAAPDNLTRLPLPPSAPALNPALNVRQHLRQNQLSLRVWPDDAAFVATGGTAWNALRSPPHRIASITRRNWARAVQT